MLRKGCKSRLKITLVAWSHEFTFFNSSEHQFPNYRQYSEKLQGLGTLLVCNGSRHQLRFLTALKDYKDENSPSNVRSVEWLWAVLQNAMIPIWPSTRCKINGVSLGDAWPLSTLAREQNSTAQSASIQPFHKLTQWLAYSLMLPFEKIVGISWKDTELLTGLPEYRNGGLFLDLGVLSLKPESLKKGMKLTEKNGSTSGLPTFDVADEVIVEWRAITVALLDELRRMLLQRHDEFFEPDEAGNIRSFKITMGQLLEAGSWKAGRKVAKERRPETGSGPYTIISDGTVF